MDMLKVFPVSELPEGARRVVNVGLRKVLVINFKGEILAVDSSCPHMRFPLKDGKVTADCGIICPFHHSAFDLKTGDVKEWAPWPPGLGPILGKIAREKALPVYATKVEDDYLWVSKQPSLY
ncbi:MAG: (2Fe-2S)-binding protein [Chloroflexi bacterium HGW-Chloroflexi-6]|nr:MAG: (2Fe-2S)-binding protein [Chloroflexi bacterium HGW-Chloroflexi-6]